MWEDRSRIQRFDAARIEAGMPLFGVDFDDSNLPQEVGRDAEAISFTKGCYLGQETVARIDALGHVNQRIVGVRFSGTEVPAVGTELTSAATGCGPRDVGGVLAAWSAAGAGDGAARGERGGHAVGVGGRRLRSGCACR